MTPTRVEAVEINGRQYRAVKEGLAAILAPFREGSDAKIKASVQHNKPKNNDEGDQAVFYNPIQQYNRDLSVLAIRTYGEGAVLEKKSRLQLKSKRKDRKNKKAKQDLSRDGAGVDAVESENKKRKADEANVSPVAQGGKRARLDEAEDDDEELPVFELSNAAEHENSQPTVNGRIENPTRIENTENNSSSPKVSFSILDALSASGIRAIRYAKEIPFATNVIANDVSGEAVKSIELNIDYNQLRGRVHSNVGDARAYMYGKAGNESQTPPSGYVHRFDVVDLDPYGSAAPFLDAAVQALVDGGMICVTCTDAGVFASNGYPEKCWALYNGIPLKGAFSHEAGLRLILHAVATSAAKYGIAIEPLLSLSIDFYARLFIRLHKSQQEVKVLAGTSMLVYSCDQGCGAWETQLLARNQQKKDKAGDLFFKHSFAQAPSTDKLCEHCGTKMHLGGPMWAGLLHNPYFVQRMLDNLDTLDTEVYGTTDRIRGMLTLALEEDLTIPTSNSTANHTITVTTDDQKDTPAVDIRIIPRLPVGIIDRTPLFFIPNYLAKVLHCSTPPENPLRGAIRRLGYRVTRSHCKAGSFKTDAPFSVLWEVMREWLRQRESERIPKLLGQGEYEGNAKLSRGTAGWRILGNLRGTDRQRGTRIAKGLRDNLSLGSNFGGEMHELKGILQAALYDLEHPPQELEAEKAATEPLAAAMNGDGGERQIEDSMLTNPPSATTPIQLASNGNENIVDTGTMPLVVSETDLGKLEIVFDEQLGKEKPRGKLVRYQLNPRENWGPMNRAGGF